MCSSTECDKRNNLLFFMVLVLSNDYFLRPLPLFIKSNRCYFIEDGLICVSFKNIENCCLFPLSTKQKNIDPLLYEDIFGNFGYENGKQ